MLKADFHVHTYHSRDANIKPKDLVLKAKVMGIDILAITDHNTIDGFGEVESEAKKLYKDLILFRGEEIRVKGGEIIALGISKEIPKKLSPMEACKLVREQGGFIILPHPFDRFRKGLGNSSLKILNYIDAVEVFNSRTMFSSFNKKNLSFAQKNNIPMIASSDAHFLEEFGNAWTVIDSARNRNDILKAVREGKTKADGKCSGIKPHLKTSLRRYRII
ncbi:MAG: PHP domain-containing protein [Candidatus Aenigmarchaeota archaeon]|nr:PHP domain-containing protein [Candidatus Aenigmarchaeota archaeon]